MVIEMKVPSPGESITEVEIAQWLIADGDYVEKDQAIAEVDSDKATLELPAEVSGTITLKAEEGDTIEVGAVVCLIDTEGKPSEKNTSNKSKEEPNQQAVEQKHNETSKDDTYATGMPSPSAKKISEEKGLDLNQIKGTGRGGRIIKEDVIKGIPSMGTTSKDGSRSDKREKLSMLRRKVAERLVSVKNETAMLTTFNEADMSSIFDLRKKYKEKFEKKHGVGLGFMSFFTKAVVRALNLFPDVNSMIDGDHKISYE